MDRKNLRDYGLGDYTRYIIGRPRLVQVMTQVESTQFECPNCHIASVAEIEFVTQNMPMLRSEYGLGRYLSCPACPWASPAMVAATPAVPYWWKP